MKDKKVIVVSFLEDVYAGAPDDYHVVLFDRAQADWYLPSEIPKMADIALKHSQNRDVYFNVCMQNRKLAETEWEKRNPGKTGLPNTRGYADTAAAMPGVWIDIDIKGPNHAAQNLPSRVEEAMELVDAFPLEPTYINNSGGGLHVLWLFKTLWLLDDDLERQKAKRLITSFQSYLQRVAKEKNWLVDNTADLARMLRLPGTINWKNEPKPVKIIENTGLKYEVADFEIILQNEGNSKKTEGNWLGAKPFIEPIVENCPFMQHVKNDAEVLPEPEWYASLSIISRCAGGEEIAHKWSELYPGYSPQETDKKIQQALTNAGPRTCANISDITCGEYCSECQWNGKITSPIVLGYKKNTEVSVMRITQEVLKAVVNGDISAHLKEEAILAFAHLERIDLPEFVRIKESLRKAGAPIAQLNKEIKKAQSKLRKVREHEEVAPCGNTVDKMLPDSPLPGLLMPAAYSLTEGGIFKTVVSGDDEDEVQIAHNPVIITSKLKDLEEGLEVISLAWKCSGKWENCLIERSVIADSRKIIQLSDIGFPVHSGNGGDLVKYLADLEALNEKIIPRKVVSSSIGWKREKGKWGFLLHDIFITKEDMQVQYRGLTAGDEQIAKGFHQKGEFENWLETIAIIKEYPRVLLMLYCAFSTPLLEVLGRSNYAAELANRTSTGKTSALRAAASVWGNPDEKSAYSAISSWDFTRVYVERVSAILNGLPLILDDTKRAKYPNQISDMIYAVANGRGRGRGNIKGLARTKSWTTAMLSSAETPSVYVSKDGGTRGRILEVTGLPFGKSSEETRKLVTAFNSSIKDNYGFAGPAFVEYILDNQDRWDTWKQELKKLEASFALKQEGEVAGRLAEHAALITLTGKLVHDALPLTWEFSNPLDSLWEGIIYEAKDSTGELAALQHVISWAYSNSERFEGREAKNLDRTVRIPNLGWAGRWDIDNSWAYIAFLPNVLKGVLKEAGFDPEAIIRGWKELKWLDLKNEERSTRQLSFQEKITWMIPIRRKATEMIGQEIPEELKDEPELIYKLDGSYFPEKKDGLFD